MVGTMGLACDRDGYDLRVPQCRECGSRGCPKHGYCKGGWTGTIVRVRPLPGESVPNRLKGTTINDEGDAI